MGRREPPVRRRAMQAVVLRARDQFTGANERNAELLRPLIEAHLAAYRASLDELTRAHRLVSDSTDLDLIAESRGAAIWLMAGRCLGQARGCLHLVAGGFAHEVPALLRQLHESNQLLNALTARSEENLLDAWLRGKYVPPGDAMAATDRHQRLLREQMIRAGEAPPRATKRRAERMYGHLSEFTHNRRARVLDIVSAEQRLMPIGPHPDWSVRAAAVGDVGIFVTETATVAGFGLSLLLGREWFVQRFNPTFHALVELGRKAPIDGGSMNEARRSDR
jgi:hypothetical protein